MIDDRLPSTAEFIEVQCDGAAQPDFVDQQSVGSPSTYVSPMGRGAGAQDVDAVIITGLRPEVAARPASSELRGRRRRRTGKATRNTCKWSLRTRPAARSAVSQRVLHRRAYADVGISAREAGRRANGLRRGDGDPGRIDPIAARVYWGWFGLKLLQEGGHHAK